MSSSVSKAIEDMRLMVEKLRLEVAAMEKTLDELWQRTCPQCLNPLSKADPAEPWRCEKCGWEE
jgi:ribosomal protein L37AE/L43A